MTNTSDNTSNDTGDIYFGKDYDWPIAQGITYVNKRGVGKRAIVPTQISTALRCSNTKYIDLKVFDMSCTRSVLAHNLESTLSGNISNNFKPFNYQENRELIRSSLSQMPTLPLPDPVANLSDLSQTFECNSLLNKCTFIVNNVNEQN
ncbi:MAG: hypothetical protein HQK51_02550 [Oligoflexia bacterium]|nr:hypothetical protein [Oligoflexia bacterium]